MSSAHFRRTFFPKPKSQKPSMPTIIAVTRKLSSAQAVETHQAIGLQVSFFYPFDNARWIGRIFQFDRDRAFHLELLDCLEIGRDFHDTLPGGRSPWTFPSQSLM